VVAERNLLPIGIAEGCRLKKAISKDQVITLDDVELPKDNKAVQLRQQQNDRFSA